MEDPLSETRIFLVLKWEYRQGARSGFMNEFRTGRRREGETSVAVYQQPKLVSDVKSEARIYGQRVK